MKNMRAMLAAGALVALAAAACKDSSPGAPKIVPPPPAPGRGAIIGAVDGATNKVTFTPAGMSADYSGGASPASYGNQGVTVTVYGTVDSVITVPGVSKTWYIRIGFRNLESYPIGSNFGATAPPDTSGVFLFFSSGAPVVTSPSSCSGCTMTVPNTMGTTNFTAPGQTYFWYRNRLMGLQGSPSTDTSYNNPEWQFKANSDQVTGFRFTIMVNSDWPPPYQSSWTGEWVAALDSLPDDNGSPPWHEYTVPGDPKLGIDTMRGSYMALIAHDSATSIYMARNDSIGNMSAMLNVYVKDSVIGGQSYQAVFGIAEPSPGKQVFIGLVDDKIDFLSFNNVNGAWTKLAGATTCSTTGCTSNTTGHTYSLRKFGTDSVALCIDGVRRMELAYSSLQATQSSFYNATVIFGVKGYGKLNTTSYWTSASYTLGAGAAGAIATGGTGACTP